MKDEKLSRRFWLYAPGQQSCNWEADIRDGVMGLAMDSVCDLRGLTAGKIAARMRRGETGRENYEGIARYAVRFRDDVRVGDVVFMKQGARPGRLLAVGVVTGEYRPRPSRGAFIHTRAVKWQGVSSRRRFHFGEMAFYQVKKGDIQELLDVAGVGRRIGGMLGPSRKKASCANKRGRARAIRDCAAFARKLRTMTQVQVKSEATRRIGQDKLRRLLMEERGGKCQLSEIADPRLLVASHIVEWSKCRPGEHLDTDNVLLLAANYDAAFDKHYISFDPDSGTMLFARRNLAVLRRLGIDTTKRIRPTPGMKKYLVRHNRLLIRK